MHLENQPESTTPESENLVALTKEALMSEAQRNENHVVILPEKAQFSQAELQAIVLARNELTRNGIPVAFVDPNGKVKKILETWDLKDFPIYPDSSSAKEHTGDHTGH